MHLIKMAAAIAFSFSVALCAYAQSSRPQFDAASVKRNINGTASDFQVAPGGRLIAINRTVSDLIFHAYNLRPYQIPDRPEWTHLERYDIEAKAEGNPSWAEMMPLLQNILEDRFKLKSHWDTKELPVFFITAAKGGIKLKPSTAHCIRFDTGAAARTAAEAATAPPVCRAGQLTAGEGGKRLWIVENAGISDVTYVLSNLLGRKIIDKTDFPGRFDFSIEFSADPLKADTNVPSLLTVMQDELGIRVESGKGSVDVFVVDQIEHPSEN
jgi:uncharacterized protein (TIGR03435 family)